MQNIFLSLRHPKWDDIAINTNFNYTIQTTIQYLINGPKISYTRRGIILLGSDNQKIDKIFMHQCCQNMEAFELSSHIILCCFSLHYSINLTSYACMAGTCPTIFLTDQFLKALDSWHHYRYCKIFPASHQPMSFEKPQKLRFRW